jgi:zinc transporter ZupT
MGPLVPLLAIIVSLLMLAGATREQLLGGTLALLAGAVLFIANNMFPQWATRKKTLTGEDER